MDPAMAARITEQHLACRLFTHVDWTEDRVALALQDDLSATIPPALARSPFEGLEALRSDVSTAAAENPTFDDITVEPLTEKLVSRMMQKMDPRNQEKDIRKVIRGDGRVRKGGRKEYGGVVPPYPHRDRPLLPPIMTRQADSSLPHIGSLRGEVLCTFDQLTAKDGRFSIVQPVEVVHVKEPDFDREAAAGQKIAVNPQLLSAAKAWRKPLIRSFISAMQAHDHELERMPRWKQWEARSARQIKESTAKAHIPLMPRQAPYRPPRHAYHVEPFEVNHGERAETQAELEDVLYEGLLELEAFGDAPWDVIECPEGIESYTKDPVHKWMEALREKDAGEGRRKEREMRWMKRRTEEAEQLPQAEDDRNAAPLDCHYSSPAGVHAERYYYQHPQSSPVSHIAQTDHHLFSLATIFQAEAAIAPPFTPQRHHSHAPPHTRTSQAPSPQHMAAHQASSSTSRRHADAKRKHWSDATDLRQIALRRRLPESADMSRPETNTSFDARTHLEEQRFLLTGIAPSASRAAEQHHALDTLDEPELDEEEALLARRQQEEEDRIAAKQAAEAPVALDDTELANPEWYRKAIYVARSLGDRSQPLPVLASLQLFQHRPLVSALQVQGLEVMDEETYLGGADLVPWATVGILFRPLASLGLPAVYEALIKALKTAALYYERVLLVLEAKSGEAEGVEEDLIELMEALEEDDDPLRAVREPNTPRRPKDTGGSTAARSRGLDEAQGVFATANSVKVTPPTRQALSRLRRYAATFAVSNTGPIGSIATKIDILFARNGVDEVAGAIRALAEHEEAKRLGRVGDDRAWLRVDSTADERALVESFHLNPFAARLVLHRHQPLDRFIAETEDGAMERELGPLMGAHAAKRFVKILQDEKRMLRQREQDRMRQVQQDAMYQGSAHRYPQAAHYYTQEQQQYQPHDGYY